MNNEQKERGAKFKGSAGLNKNKTTPKHPDFKGSETIAGVEYWVAVWVNKNDDGTSWLSFEHEAKEALPNLVDSYKKKSAKIHSQTLRDLIPEPRSKLPRKLRANKPKMMTSHSKLCLTELSGTAYSLLSVSTP